MKSIVMIGIFLWSFAPFAGPLATGGEVGNGGGGVCLNGKCVSLVEAGLRIKREFDGHWIPSTEMISEVHRLTDDSELSGQVLPLDLGAKLRVSGLGRLTHFRLVEEEDPAKLEKIKELYLSVAEDANFEVDPRTFEIFAISSDDTATECLTYILPSFFNLELEQQAKLLIHEGMYRCQPSGRLPYILGFEGAWEDLIAVNGVSHRLKLDLALFSYELSYFNKENLLGLILMVMHNPKATDDHDMVEPNDIGTLKYLGRTEDKYQLDLSIDKLLGFGALDNRIPFIFSKTDQLIFERNDACVIEKRPFAMVASGEGYILELCAFDAGNYMYGFRLINPDQLDLVLGRVLNP